MMKKGLFFLSTLVIAGGIVWGWRAEIQEYWNPPVQELILNGNIDDRQVNLTFLVSERIAQILVEEGTSVRKGDLLGTLETVRIEKDMATAEAAVKVARENLRKAENGYRREEIAKSAALYAGAQSQIKPAKRDFDRQQGLHLSGAVSDQDVDDAEAAYRLRVALSEYAKQDHAMKQSGTRTEEIAIARAQLEQAEAEWNRLEQTLADTKLYAPCDGVVRRRILEPGEMASPQSTVLQLAVWSPKWVRVYLPESLLSTITQDAKGVIRSDGWKEPFEGWVGFISPTAEFTPKNVETPELRTSLVYECRVYVKDPENRLKLGAPVTVTFSEIFANR